MLSIRTFLIAEDVVRDTTSNTVTIVKLIEQITAEAYPLIIPKAMLYVLVDREATDKPEQILQFQFLLYGQLEKDNSFPITFKGQNAARIIVNLGGLEFPKAGEAQFTIRNSDGDVLQTYRLDLSLRDIPQTVS